MQEKLEVIMIIIIDIVIIPVVHLVGGGGHIVLGVLELDGDVHVPPTYKDRRFKTNRRFIAQCLI